MTAEALRTDSATRPPLSRARILDTALAMIDRDGLDALSMRRLAAELDVSAMSLYHHVPNKEALLMGVTERLFAEIDLAAADAPDWCDALRAGFKSFRRALLAHPNAIALIEMKPAVTPDAMRPVEVSIGTLRRAGFDADESIKAHWVLVGYTIGHVNFQCVSPFLDRQQREQTLRERHHLLPPEQFPNFLEAMSYVSTCDFEEAYEWGLDVILAGLTGRLGSRALG
jgi:AcrR family transcriptional regulator